MTTTLPPAPAYLHPEQWFNTPDLDRGGDPLPSYAFTDEQFVDASVNAVHRFVASRGRGLDADIVTGIAPRTRRRVLDDERANFLAIDLVCAYRGITDHIPVIDKTFEETAIHGVHTVRSILDNILPGEPPRGLIFRPADLTHPDWLAHLVAISADYRYGTLLGTLLMADAQAELDAARWTYRMYGTPGNPSNPHCWIAARYQITKPKPAPFGKATS